MNSTSCHEGDGWTSGYDSLTSTASFTSLNQAGSVLVKLGHVKEGEEFLRAAWEEARAGGATGGGRRPESASAYRAKQPASARGGRIRHRSRSRERKGPDVEPETTGRILCDLVRCLAGQGKAAEIAAIGLALSKGALFRLRVGSRV